MIRKVVVVAVIAGALGLLLAQAVPYGRDHGNPRVTAEPPWNAPETRALFMRACGDCHSNETVWPFYSNIAPVSWLIQRDVDGGRKELNVSQWGSGRNSGRDSAEQVQEGTMPPAYYKLAHPTARLSSAERDQLIAGLSATFGRGR